MTVRHELRSWQVRRGDVERLLRNAVFGPGATAMLADRIEPGVGIMVDESRDPALARAFDASCRARRRCVPRRVADRRPALRANGPLSARAAGAVRDTR